MKIDSDKLEVANKVLALIMPEATVKLSVKNNTIYIAACYERKEATEIKVRRVRVKPNSDYLYGDRWFPSGGTCQRATVELVRWLRGKPSNDIRLWQHWCSSSIGMAPDSIIQILVDAGYPERSAKGYWSQ